MLEDYRECSVDGTITTPIYPIYIWFIGRQVFSIDPGNFWLGYQKQKKHMPGFCLAMINAQDCPRISVNASAIHNNQKKTLHF